NVNSTVAQGTIITDTASAGPTTGLKNPTYTSASLHTTVAGVPTVTVTDGGTYNGNPYNAVGSAVGVDGKTAVAGSFSSTHYASDGATVFDGVPTNAASYYVTAAFTSNDSNYVSAGSTETSFSIGKAKPAVTVTDGGTYTGNAYNAVGSAMGVD